MGKPTLKQFETAVSKCGGNLSKVAETFHTCRAQIYRWINTDNSFKEVVSDARMKLFDECLSTARLVSIGIPDIQDNKFVGWIEKPESNMLRYLIGCLGKNEGFGESVDVTSGGEKMSLRFQLVTNKADLKALEDEVPDIYNE